MYRQGVNSLSIVGRLSTLQSVHYQRFHCILAGGEQFVHCREVVHSSECPLSEVPLYQVLPVIAGVCVCVLTSHECWWRE